MCFAIHMEDSLKASKATLASAVSVQTPIPGSLFFTDNKKRMRAVTKHDKYK